MESFVTIRVCDYELSSASFHLTENKTSLLPFVYGQFKTKFAHPTAFFVKSIEQLNSFDFSLCPFVISTNYKHPLFELVFRLSEPGFNWNITSDRFVSTQSLIQGFLSAKGVLRIVFPLKRFDDQSKSIAFTGNFVCLDLPCNPGFHLLEDDPHFIFLIKHLVHSMILYEMDYEFIYRVEEPKLIMKSFELTIQKGHELLFEMFEKNDLNDRDVFSIQTFEYYRLKARLLSEAFYDQKVVRWIALNIKKNEPKFGMFPLSQRGSCENLRDSLPLEHFRFAFHYNQEISLLDIKPNIGFSYLFFVYCPLFRIYLRTSYNFKNQITTDMTRKERTSLLIKFICNFNLRIFISMFNCLNNLSR